MNKEEFTRLDVSAQHALCNVITFLEENEQYGDDWSKEIKVLKKILEN
jgi:hypothetical protein